MGLYKRVCLPISLRACLGQAAFAQCSHATTLTEEQRELENRTVLLSLKLSGTGAVRDAKVIRGPEALRAPAIKAAKARKYKHRIVYSFPDPREMMVEVKFPEKNGEPPAIRQALQGGVPSCLSLPVTVRVVPESMQSRLVQRVEPVYPPDIQQIAGVLVLRIHVDKGGNVLAAEKVSGPDAPVAPAIEAIKRWKYEPFLFNGEPVEVETTVELKIP